MVDFHIVFQNVVSKKLFYSTTQSECVTSWEHTTCSCEKGRVGPQCVAACELNPCGAYASCLPDIDQPAGYRCKCDNGYSMTGKSYYNNKKKIREEKEKNLTLAERTPLEVGDCAASSSWWRIGGR